MIIPARLHLNTVGYNQEWFVKTKFPCVQHWWMIAIQFTNERTLPLAKHRNFMSYPAGIITRWQMWWVWKLSLDCHIITLVQLWCVWCDSHFKNNHITVNAEHLMKTSPQKFCHQWSNSKIDNQSLGCLLLLFGIPLNYGKLYTQ